MRLRGALSLFLLVLGSSACGAKTGLDPFELATSATGGAPGRGGSSAAGGTSSSGGSATGGVAGASGSGGSLGFSGSSSFGGTSASGGGSTGGASGASGSGGFGGVGGSDPTGGSGGQAENPARAVDLALGAFHSCVRFDDGSLRCWGTGGYIGSGNTATIGNDETPDAMGDVDIGGAVTQLAASWWHTCAVLDSGNVRCFGDGLSGALGYGNTQVVGDDETPASVGDVRVGGNVEEVSAGPFHTCARFDDGKLRCWGRNSHFQLGYSSSETIGDDEDPASASPVDVGGVVVQVAAGYTHTCVLLDAGKVRCWGTGDGGSLGYGNENTIGDDESPASAGDVDLGGTAVQVVAGTQHSCALLDNGRVRCWGFGSRGRLGYGNTANVGDDETPATAGDVDVGGTVTQLAAGDFSTCALLTGGRVRCWGAGEQGELGYGNLRDVGDDETPASAGDVDVGGPVTRIDVGFLHTCATLAIGAVRCWGRGTTGALGYGNVKDIGDDETPASAGDVKTH